MLILLNESYLQALDKITTSNHWITLVLMFLLFGIVLLKAITNPFSVNINKYFVWFSFSGFILFITLIGIAKFDKSFLFILLTPIASYFGYLFFNANVSKRISSPIELLSISR